MSIPQFNGSKSQRVILILVATVIIIFAGAGIIFGLRINESDTAPPATVTKSGPKYR